jgi:hypothetical protein
LRVVGDKLGSARHLATDDLGRGTVECASQLGIRTFASKADEERTDKLLPLAITSIVPDSAKAARRST